jgi:poly(3-hydroxyalkanoate) synthetase
MENIFKLTSYTKYSLLSGEKLRYAQVYKYHGVGVDPVNSSDKLAFNFQHWEPKRNKKSPAIVINPPTGGKTFLDNWIAKIFVKNGYEVFLITDLESNSSTKFNIIDLDSHDAGSLRGVAVIKYITQRIDSDRDIYLLGTSLGGIFSALYVPFDNRVKKSIFVVAGSPLSSVIAYSDQKRLSEFRKKRMSHYNLESVMDYEDLLRSSISYEPISFLQKSSLPKAMFYIASEDKVVPTNSQYQLMREFPDSFSYEFTGGHVGSIIKFGLFHKKKALKFFDL